MKMKSLKNILLWLGAATVAFTALSCEELPDTVQGIPYSDAATGVFYEWPSYSPTIHYNLKEDPEFKDLAAPTKNLAWNQAAKIYDNGKYWSYYEGRNANSVVKGNEAAVEKMFDQLEADAAYLRDEMGWPPTTNVRKGFRDAVFLFGSQLGTDTANNTDLG